MADPKLTHPFVPCPTGLEGCVRCHHGYPSTSCGQPRAAHETAEEQETALRAILAKIDGYGAAHEGREEPEIDNSYRVEGVPLRRFYLLRTKDETGISRTGRVLEGVLTQSGKVFVEWRPPHSTMGIYNSLQEFMTIHVDCHPSCNEVVWLDR